MKTTTEVKHTPTPWDYTDEVTGKGWLLLDADQPENTPSMGTIHCEEDAAFIVRAVNAHDDLLEALQGCLEIAECHAARLKAEWAQENNSDDAKSLLVALEDETHACIDIAKAAIRKAEGGK